MKFSYKDELIDVIVLKKKNTKHTYIRVKSDGKIYITTNIFTTDRQIKKLLKSEEKAIIRMINTEKIKKKNSDGFFFLGKRYDIVYVTYTDFSLGEDRVFMKKDFDIYKWYKKQAKRIFKERLDYCFSNYSKDIPNVSLRVRKMTTRWGVCNVRSHVITLNLELIKRDIKYLDYVIIHELSHLVEANHSSRFWSLVEENYPDYKKVRKEMKLF